MKRTLPCCIIIIAALLVVACGGKKRSNALSDRYWYIAYSYTACIYPNGSKDEAAYYYSAKTSKLRFKLDGDEQGLGVVWDTDSADYTIVWRRIEEKAIYFDGFLEGDGLWTINELTNTDFTISQQGEIGEVSCIRTLSFVSNLKNLLDKAAVDSLNRADNI